MEFGTKLRGELVELQSLAGDLRRHNRTSSNDTRRISLDSMSSGIESVDHGFLAQRFKGLRAQKLEEDLAQKLEEDQKTQRPKKT